MLQHTQPRALADALGRIVAHIAAQPPGSLLPSERALARQWSVSHNAVNRAVSQLIAQGTLRRDGRKLRIATAPVQVPLRAIIVISPIPAVHQAAREVAALHRVFCEHHELSDSSRLPGIIREAADRPAGGVLIGFEVPPALLEGFRDRPVPVVVCGRYAPATDSLELDHASALRGAVDHLFARNHRELAYICYRRPGADWTGEYIAACRERGLVASEARIFFSTSDHRLATRAAARRLLREAPGVTGVVCQYGLLGRRIAEALHEENRRVPDDFSIVCCHHSEHVLRADPPLTAASPMDRELAQLGTTLLIRRMIETTAHLPIRWPPITARVEPTFIERDSVRVLPAAPRPQQDLSSAGTSYQSLAARCVWLPLQYRKRAAEESWGQRYGLTRNAAAERFTMLDLRAHMNRSVTRNNAWLGNLPLRHLPPGRLLAHGVPFDVTDERANSGRGAILLSPRTPEAVIELPQPAHASALYFLHAAGYATEREMIASYTIDGAGTALGEVPITPYAAGPGANDDPEQWLADTTIQDWWPDAAQVQAPNARHVVLTDGGDPLAYERYLYSLQWVNPHPDKPIHAIRLRHTARTQAVVAVLAISLLQNPDGKQLTHSPAQGK